MRLRWNARADTVSSVVLWVGSLIAALICATWLARNLQPEHVTLQSIDNELDSLQRSLNTACRMDSYWKKHYPSVNKGNLVLNNLQVCIDSSECRVVFYKGGLEPVFEDGAILVNQTLPCDNIMSCTMLYYSSSEDPYVGSDYLYLSNATTCENAHPPIRRCRLLTCELNCTLNTGLATVTYLNLTKFENGTFSATAH